MCERQPSMASRIVGPGVQEGGAVTDTTIGVTTGQASRSRMDPPRGRIPSNHWHGLLTAAKGSATAQPARHSGLGPYSDTAHLV